METAKSIRAIGSLLAICFVCISLICAGGCRERQLPVAGGTAGSLTAGEIAVPDFEIKLHEAGSNTLLGVAMTGKDGKFQLQLPKGGPLWLNTGDYVVTLESIGPSPPRMPAAYSNAAKTPLKVNWKSTDSALDLKIPAFK